jgi:hypothetical protein
MTTSLYATNRRFIVLSAEYRALFVRTQLQCFGNSGSGMQMMI